jgi:hypothetical protein
MKNIICTLGLFVATSSFAANIGEIEENNRIYNSFDLIECVNIEVESNEALGCSTSTTSTVKTNLDGSSTRTTTTTTSCDTPQELAQVHALMAAIGMGI